MGKCIGIVGLGLIGGSLAKAIKMNTMHIVYGVDIDEKTVRQATMENAIDNGAYVNSISECDIIIVALYPNATRKFVRNNIDSFKKGCIIVDCAGVKVNICDEMTKLCEEHGCFFVGGHPMAGCESSGFAYSCAKLFNGACMILCSEHNTNALALKQVEQLFLSIGFGTVTVTTAVEHDKIIAFTSQLAHIVSSSYIKSEAAKFHKGFSAGSFRDLTRVAKLNETMWTELFFNNKANLINEIDNIIIQLVEYKTALQTDNYEQMKQLLLDGKCAKEATEK